MSNLQKLALKKQVRSSVLNFGDVALASNLLKIYEVAFLRTNDIARTWNVVRA